MLLTPRKFSRKLWLFKVYYLILFGRHEVSIFFSISNIFSTSRKPFLRPVWGVSESSGGTLRRCHFRMKCQWESGRNLSMTCSAPPSFPIPMLLLCPLRQSLPRSRPVISFLVLGDILYPGSLGPSTRSCNPHAREHKIHSARRGEESEDTTLCLRIRGDY